MISNEEKYSTPTPKCFETPGYSRMTEAPKPAPTNAGPTEYITIPVAEYMYLQRLDALMDVLLLDAAYASSHTIEAVKDTVVSMRMANKPEAGAEE